MLEYLPLVTNVHFVADIHYWYKHYRFVEFPLQIPRHHDKNPLREEEIFESYQAPRGYLPMWYNQIIPSNRFRS